MKLKGLLVITSFILLLSACGQGNDNGDTTPIDRTGNSQSADHDDMNNESNDVNHSQEDNEAEQVEDNNEDNSDATNDVATVENVTLFFSDDQLLATYRVNTGVT